MANTIARRCWRLPLLTAVAACLLGLSSTIADEQRGVDATMKELAGDIAKRLRAQGETKIALGRFTGSAKRLQMKLIDQLQKIKIGDKYIEVTPTAGWRLSVDCQAELSDGKVVALVQSQLTDRNGRAAGRITKYIVVSKEEWLAL